MYEFRDTIDHSDLTVKLPSEAMNFGGVFLENEVEGYKTLTVTGREPLTRNVKTLKVGNNDGEIFKNSSITPRYITVKFLLMAAIADNLQVRMTKLKKLLYTEIVEIFFNDDDLRYVKGIVSNVDVISEGQNNIQGTIKITCSDPNWYSRDEIKESAVNGKASIDYKGSYVSRPRIEVTMNSDNGFIALIDGNGNLLQFGTPEEVDGVVRPRTVQRINDNVNNDWNAGTIVEKGWTYNNAPKLIPINKIMPVQSGAVAFNQYTIRYGKWKGQLVKYIGASNYGTGSTWHGPTITRKFVPDTGENQKDTVKDFQAGYDMNFIIGATGQVGCQQWVLTTKEGLNVAAIVVYKNTTSNNDTMLEYWINGGLVHSRKINPLAVDIFTGWDGGNFSIRKYGNKIRFANKKDSHEFTLTPAIALMEVHSVSMFYGVWANASPPSTVIKGSAITHNHSRAVRFDDNKVEFWNDVPNRFSKFDKITIDVVTGEVLWNNLPSATFGALGNDWEKFGLVNGINDITVVNSSFAIPEPAVDIFYREVSV